MNLIELEKELEKFGDVFIQKFQEHGETQGDKVFFYYGEEDRSYTYAEFNNMANSFARGLMGLGVEKGDRVSLFLFNPLASSIAMFGIWKAGAVYCPINFNLKGNLLAYHINDTHPKVLISEQGFVGALNHIKEDIPAVRVVLYRPQKSDHDFSPDAAQARLDEKFDRVVFHDLLTGDPSNPNIPLEYGDTASIIYTSGTTGYPKGVVQSHRYLHNYLFPTLRITHPDDVHYNDLPLYHVGGAFFGVVRAAWAGCGVAVWDKFSPNEYWERIRQSGANSAALLDIMIPWLMMKEESPDDRHNSLKGVYMQPLPANHHEVAKRFGIDFVTVGYASTEAGAAFGGVIDEFGDQAGTPVELLKGYTKDEIREKAGRFDIPVVPGWEPVRKGFIGRPLILLDIKILDENGRPAAQGQPGQAVFREKLPHLTIEEYFNKPEATAEALKDGWFYSGDILVEDEDSIYRFVDRIGGFIRSRGENMSSHTVEGMLQGHPAVSNAAVFPVPSEVGHEEDIAAFIVLNQGAKLSEEELRSWMAKEMPKYMWPRHIRFVDNLPATPTFKVEKYKLKDMIIKELGLT